MNSSLETLLAFQMECYFGMRFCIPHIINKTEQKNSNFVGEF